MVKSLFSTSINLYLVAFVTSALGFASQILIARSYGASDVMDAYLVSIAVPVFLASLVASACSYGLVPKLTAYHSNPREFVCYSQVMFTFGLIAAFVFMVMLLFVPTQVSYFSGFSSVDRQTLVFLFRVGWGIGASQILAAICAAVLNARASYISSTILAWFPYLGILLSIIFVDQEKNIHSLSLGLLFGTLTGVLIGFLHLCKSLLSNYDYFLITLPKYFYEIAAASIKSVTFASIFTSYLLVDIYWAPILGDGVMSVLGYAQRLLGSGGALAITAVYVFSGREAQAELSSNGIGAFRRLCFAFIKTSLLLSVALAVFFFIFIEAILDLLFSSNNFDEEDLKALATTMKLMLPGMVCMLLSVILTKLILCLDNSGYKALGIALLWPCLYFLGIYFLFDFGLIGAAVSYSVAWFVLAAMLLTNFLSSTTESS